MPLQRVVSFSLASRVVCLSNLLRAASARKDAFGLLTACAQSSLSGLGGLGDVVGAGALVDGGAKGMLPGRSLGAGHRADAGCASVHVAVANPHVGLRNLHVDRRNPYVESRNLSVHDANPYVDGPMLHVGASTVYVDGRNPYVAT